MAGAGGGVGGVRSCGCTTPALAALSCSPGHLATLFCSSWEEDSIKAVKPCFERARNKAGLLCRKGHIVFVFQIRAAFGIRQLSDFNGCLQTGSQEYFDLFGHWADLQPAVLAVVFLFK